MNVSSTRWRAWPTAAGAATAVAVLAMALSACDGPGGGGKSPSPKPSHSAPAGFQKVDAGKATFAVPQGWRHMQPPQGWSAARQLPDTKQQGRFAQAGVITDVPQTEDVKTVATATWAGTLFNAPHLKRSPEKHVKVPGARDAIRVDYTYETTGAGNTSVPMRGADLAITYGDSKAIAFRVTGVRKKLSAATVNQIVGTVAVGS